MREDWEEYVKGEENRWNGLADMWNRWVNETEAPEGNSSSLNEIMFDLAGIEEGMEVLDLCTGNGEVAIHVAQKVGSSGRVIAVDQSHNVLEFARSRTEAAGVSDRIEFVQIDAHNVSFDEGSFDAILCRFGIFFLPDLTRVLQNAHRMLKPGGKFVCNVWGQRTESFEHVAKAVKQFGLAEINPESLNIQVLKSEDQDKPKMLQMLQPVHFSSDAANVIKSAMISEGFLESETVSVVYINVFDSPDHYMEMNAPFSSAGHGVLEPGSPAWSSAIESVQQKVENDGKIRLPNDVDFVWGLKDMADK